MRATLVVGMMLVACSSPPGPVDAGTDAGVDAGPPPVCLDPDAGMSSADAGDRDGGNFSCAGVMPPRGAEAKLTVAGFVTAAGLTRPTLDGALVELFSPAGAVVASAVSADAGQFSLETMTGCLPFDGYLRGSQADAGFYDIYYYPPAPLQRSRKGLELSIFDNAARALVSGFANVTIMNDTGALALGIEDCLGDPVSGATVSTAPPGDVRYVSSGGIPSNMITETSSKGQALVFNLPPGNVTITVMVGGRTLPARTVNARANAITTTTIRP